MTESSSPKQEKLTTLQRSFLVIEQLQAKLDKLEKAKREPIAIIGMGCRLPGGANNPQEFWELLQEGRDAISEVPSDRWDINEYYDPDPATPGKIYTRCGGFIEQLQEFDPIFFGISPRETISLDPQQRLLLEVSWEALEHAAINPQELVKSKTGVFVGISGFDYFPRLLNRDPKEIDAYLLTGIAHSTASGRLSYVLGLTGPSFSVDTACSSSLVGIHLACASLRNKESDLGIAAGVNRLLTPEGSINFSKARMLSADGRCKTFDASADGFSRSEGCGVIILKRLADALADGDNILATIRGSAINQDGHTSGLTVPNGPSQESVIREALKNGDIDPATVSYIEAHGTGTSLGDPIEMGALKSVFGKTHSQAQPLIVGSVKTNMGHLEAAAGIAGLMKVVLQLQNKEIAPHLHFHEPNPYINWAELPVVVQTKPTRWQVTGKSRIAGVSSFGFSGTNAHILLEEAPEKTSDRPSPARPLEILTLSGKTPAGLSELESRYQQHLEGDRELELADICYTSNIGRAHFNYRTAIIASSKQELAAKIKQINSPSEWVGIYKGDFEDEPKVAFLFTGQGSQYVDMGRELYETQSVFREALDECDRLLQDSLERPLLEVIYPQDGQADVLTQTAYTQPSLFAIEYALASLWQSWGIKPDAVMGHSVGEYVAATVAGLFSLSDGLKLIAARGRLMQQLPAGGEMVAVRASVEKMRSLIAPYADSVSLAAINGPESTVISGENEAVLAICSQLEDKGIKTKPLQVSHAFHSHLMSPMLADFAAVASQVTYSQPTIPIISNVTGQVGTDKMRTPEYWVSHVRQPVLFADSMNTLHDRGHGVFVEIGPKPILLGMGRECLPDDVGVWLPSLRPGCSDWQQMLYSLGELYVQGTKVDWPAFNQEGQGSKVILPTYPFQRENYWMEEGNLRLVKVAKSQTDSHPLIGQKLHLPASKEIRFESQITPDFPAYLKDHAVYGMVVFLGAGYLEMALAAGQRVFNSQNMELEEVKFVNALIFPEDKADAITLHLVCEQNDNQKQSYDWKIYSFANDMEEWKLHAYGKVANKDPEAVAPIEIATLQAKFKDKEIADFYKQVYDIAYGPLLRNLERVWQSDGEALGKITLQAAIWKEAEENVLHPVITDSCFQTMFTLLSEEAVKDRSPYIPIGCQNLKVYCRPTTEIWSHVQLRDNQNQTSPTLMADINLFTPDGQVIATIAGLQGKKTTAQALIGNKGASLENILYEVEWRPKGRFSRVLQSLRSPSAVQEKLDNGTGSPSVSQSDLDEYASLLEELEQLSVEYVLQAFKQMGWPFQPGTGFSTEIAAQRLGVVPTQRRLFNRMLQMLGEEGILEYNSEQWRVLQPLAEVNPEATSKTLLQQYPQGQAELTMLSRCGNQLSAVLRGASDPVEAVFPKGDLTTATQLYQESPLAKVMNGIVGDAIATGIEEVPLAEGVRLLEIGAGTGGTTSYILPKLNASQTEYVFTDIGALFTSKAQEKFSEYPFVWYQTLDIEKTPASQGFESEQYQIIVAANVLHGTTSMQETLSHVRELLAPGGLLVLMEGTVRQRWFDLIFGLLEGWWKFQDWELRPDYPLMSASTWEGLLKDKGFTEVVTIEKTKQAIIIARAAGESQVEGIPAASRNWLIMADKQGIAEQLVAKLRSEDSACTLVFAGEAYKKVGPGEYTINPQKPEEFEQLVTEVAAHYQNIYGVVQCWSMEGAPGEELSSSELAELSQQVCGSTLLLLQALVKGSLGSPPRLWLVTKGAQPIPDRDLPAVPGVGQASLWGMGKVIALEHPEFKCTRVDIDPQDTVEALGIALWAEIFSEDAEDQVALGQESRYVARLVSSNQNYDSIENPIALRSDGTYLITGGLGGLGLLVGRWMVEKGAKHLVLVGRSGVSESAKSQLKSLEEAGAEVVIAKCDVSDEEALRRVLSDIQQSLPPLAGVFHSVGLLSDGVLQQQSWSSFAKVMHPKVQGSWHLHQLTKNESLDFFVLFSSVASLLGSAGQSNHAAANAFMDALAYYRRGMGLPGLSINWGPVSEIGAAALRGSDLLLQKKGLGSISSQQVLEALELLMSSLSVEVGVVPIDWPIFLPQSQGWPFYENWRETAKLSSLTSFGLKQQLAETVASERRDVLVAHVRQQLMAVLGFNRDGKIGLKERFFDFGMDSLTSIELRNRLQNSLECSLSSTIAFDYPTIGELVDYLTQNVVELDFSEEAEGMIDEEKDELEDLSEDEIAALLAAELEFGHK